MVGNRMQDVLFNLKLGGGDYMPILYLSFIGIFLFKKRDKFYGKLFLITTSFAFFLYLFTFLFVFHQGLAILIFKLFWQDLTFLGGQLSQSGQLKVFLAQIFLQILSKF